MDELGRDKYPNLRKALLVAQRAITPVEKDARNDFHKYAYVSSEAMLIAARLALHDAGLTAERNEWVYDEPTRKVIMYFELVHAESGEARRYPVEWPIVEDRGRPLDKALAGALTTSFNYWLRDLLLVPRKDDNEVDSRDDRDHGQQQQGGKQAGGGKAAAKEGGGAKSQSKSAKAKPEPFKFDKGNQQHLQMLATALEARKVPISFHDEIAVELHGKLTSEIDKTIEHVKTRERAPNA